MNEKDILEILKKLEDFRIKLETGVIQLDSVDWVVRYCQAIVAENHFDRRVEWINKIKKIN